MDPGDASAGVKILKHLIKYDNVSKQWPHIFAYMGVREIDGWLQKGFAVSMC